MCAPAADERVPKMIIDCAHYQHDRLDPGPVAPRAPVPMATSASRGSWGQGGTRAAPRRNRVMRAWGTFPNWAGSPALPPDPVGLFRPG